MTYENSRHDAPAVDSVERLLRAFGRRQAPDAARRDVARSAVRDAWRSSVRARVRRRWMIAAFPPIAAAAGLAIVVSLQPPPAPLPAIVARVVMTTTAVQLRQGTFVRTISTGHEIPAGGVVDTQPGEIATFELPEGGEVRQDGGTSVRWIAARHVAIERGRIYIDSGSGASSAVVIETAAGVVRDIGTRFVVDVRGDQVRVRVRDGAVRLESSAGHRDASAGRELIALPGAAVVDRPFPTVSPEWDWILQSTSFRLEGATLSRFVAWVEAEGGVQVEFRPKQLRADTAATVLHGSVRGLSIQDAIAVILPAAGLSHRIEGTTVIIERTAGGGR